MLVLIGKTASGKTELLNHLVGRYHFKPIVTYTTRPIREGEIPDVTYHYISEGEFIEKISKGFFAEWKIYKTVDGNWYYGSAASDYKNTNIFNIVILTPDGIQQIQKNGLENIRIFYIKCPKHIRRKRLKNRGDKSSEVKRRIRADDKDFKIISFPYYSIKNKGYIDKALNKILSEYFMGENNIYGEK